MDHNIAPSDDEDEDGLHHGTTTMPLRSITAGWRHNRLSFWRLEV